MRSVCFVVLLLAIDHCVYAQLDAVKRDDLVEVQCDGLECATEVADVSRSVLSVWDRGLVTTKLDPALILQEHAQTASNVGKTFRGETLGYVTPWNSRGYDMAKRFRTKFTYISPVWLQVREDPDHVPIITGTHDIDHQWVQEIKYGDKGDELEGEGPAVLPRVVYERNRISLEDGPLIISRLLTLTDEHDFDGIVLEMPVMKATMDMLQRMARAFRAADKLLILVLSRSSKDVRRSLTTRSFRSLLANQPLWICC